jgi:hypothetical protein
MENEIHPDLSKVFDHFAEDKVAVVGSAIKDYEAAKDIDVLVPADVDYPALVKKLGATYSGWDLKDGSHLRRANYNIPGVAKRVQLLQNRMVGQFDQWPHAVLLRDGKTLNGDKHFTKRKDDPTYVGWKARPRKTTKDIYKSY